MSTTTPYLLTEGALKITPVLEKRGLLREEFEFEITAPSGDVLQTNFFDIWFYEPGSLGRTNYNSRYNAAGANGRGLVRTILTRLEMGLNERRSVKDLISLLPTDASRRRYKLQLLVE